MPRVSKCGVQLALGAMPSETGSNPANTAEEPSLPAEVIQTQIVLKKKALMIDHNSWTSFTVLWKWEKTVKGLLTFN